MTERRLLVAHIFYPSLIVAVAVISILVLALALQWVGQPFPGFFLDPNLLVSESWDEGWTGPKAGLDHRDRVLSVDGQPVSASQEIINLVRRTQSATVRRQAKVVLLASIMAFVPGGIWTIVSSVWYSVVAPQVVIPFFILFPLSIAYAIVKYRLFQLERLISQGMVYSTLTIFLALLYFALLTFTQTVSQELFGQSSPVLAIPFVLLVAVLFEPLRSRLQSKEEY